tara:strand:- start:70686 stop:70940 length:255 start_codon:yes stop_codon:yes gene_type:complete
MALSIKNSDVDQMARELSELTGESITEAIHQSLKERLERKTGRSSKKTLEMDIKRIQNRVAKIQRLDHRSDEEIIGYNQDGYTN